MASEVERAARKAQSGSRVRLYCTATPQMGEAVEKLLWTGLFGLNRSQVVERLLSEAIGRHLADGVLKLEDLRE